MKTLFAPIIAALIFVSCGTTPKESNTESDSKTAEEKKSSEANTSFADGQYLINSDLSTCNWVGTEITTETHTGTVNIYKGSTSVMNNSVSSGFIAMDMSSIDVTDLTGGSKERLQRHLKSEDFFGVEKFPFAELKLESIKSKGGSSIAGGILNIRGISHPIAFPISVSQDGNQLTLDGDMTFDRSKYDVKFRSGSFPKIFPNLGDKLINDDITISFHIVAES